MNTAVRCESMSRRGRCARMTKDPSKKCYQHKNGPTMTQVTDQSSDPVDNHVHTTTHVRCEGTTRAGSQCAKMTLNPNKRCHHHKQSITQNHSITVQPVQDFVAVSEIVQAPESEVSRRQTRSMGARTNHVEPSRSSDDLGHRLERLQDEVREIETLVRSTLSEARDEVQSEEKSEVRSKKGKKDKSEKKEHSHKSCKTKECCVCYEPVPENEFLECDHAVCKDCMGQLRDTRCPMCRAEIKSKNVSEKEKKRMIRRRQEDHRNRNNELFQNYMNTQNQLLHLPQILPLNSINTFIAQFTL